MNTVSRYILEVRFKASATILDKRGEIADKIEKAIFETWRIGPGRIEFSTINNENVKAFISIRNFGLTSQTPNDEKYFIDKAKEFIDIAWDCIPTKEITRVGIRCLTFTQITSVMDSVVSFRENYSKFSDEYLDNWTLEDFSSELNMANGDKKMHTFFRPMNKDEALSQFEILKDSEVAEEGLFIDTDIFTSSFEVETKKAIIHEFLTTALERSSKFREDTLKLLKLGK